MAPKKRTVAFPVSSSAILQPTIPVPLRGCYALGADFGTGGKYPRFDITPERDETCVPWPQWRSAACVQPRCRRACGTILRARFRAGSEARAMRAGSWSSLHREKAIRVIEKLRGLRLS